MRPTLRAALAVLSASALLATGVHGASAHDLQTDGGVSVAMEARHLHEGEGGHLAPTSQNVEVVSQLAMKNVVPEKIADVGVHKGYAYLAAWGSVTCKYNGVHVVDIRNVNAPKEVAFIQAKEGSAPGEGIQALTIDTPAFKGDVLLSNNEICKDKAGFGGLNIYDVTNPAHPTPLVEGLGDTTANGQGKKTANEIHSVFAWDAGDKAYAVIVDNEEGPDVDIVDITNPKKAKLVAEYDLDQLFPQIVQAQPSNLVEVFFHDVVVKEIAGRQIMLLSYWDGGYVKVDVTNPLAPVYLADTDFAAEDPEFPGTGIVPEGNAHQAEFTGDNAYVIAADEDFNPYALDARNVTDGTPIIASQGDGTTQLTPGTSIEGRTTFVGRACPGDPAVPPGDPAAVDVAVVERGVCTFTEKVTAVSAAGGWDAVLIFNRVGSDACNQTLGMSVEGSLPTFGVMPREQGFALFGAQGQYDDAACNAQPSGAQLAPIALGTTGDVVRFSSHFDGWGYVHLYRNGTLKLAELDTYAIPEAHDPAFARGFGDLSVHEVAVSATDNRLAYFSYYSGGFRVARIVNDQLVEVGRHIGANGNNLWGVQVFQSGGVEYVAASDRDFGLIIYRYTGN